MNNNIFFFMHYYGEYFNAQLALNTFRQCYPDNQLVIISEKEYADAGFLASKYNAIHLPENRLKTIEYGGQWSERFFQKYLLMRNDEDIVCRFDPDVTWHFPLIFEEQNRHQWESDIFGTMSLGFSFPYTVIRGGCIFYRLNAVKSILESGLLDNLLYKNNYFGYKRYSDANLIPGETESEEWLSSQDKILSHIADVLNLKVSDFSEIMIIYRNQPSKFQTKRNWAVTNFHI